MATIPSVSGGIPLPGLQANAFIIPKSILFLSGQVRAISSLGLYTQKGQFGLASAQLELGLFPFKKEIVKQLTFQTSEKGLMYTWRYPVKRNFRFGFVAGINTGSRYVQTGNDEATGIYWNGATDPRGNKLSLPFSFTDWSLGLGLMTIAWAKTSILLPNGDEVKKRYKALTVIRLSYVRLQDYSIPSNMEVETRGVTRNYQPQITDLQKWGIQFQGDFRRKWLSLLLTAGVATGPNYRFAEGEGGSFLNRTYVGLGAGFGWM